MSCKKDVWSTDCASVLVRQTPQLQTRGNCLAPIADEEVVPNDFATRSTNIFFYETSSFSEKIDSIARALVDYDSATQCTHAAHRSANQGQEGVRREE